MHPPEYPRVYSQQGLQLLRSQNVRTTGININANPVFFSEETLKGKRIIKPKVDDILIVRSGVNAGDIAVVENDYPNCIIGADTLLARFDSKIIPKYIQVFFATNVGKLLLSRYITGATNTHLSPHSFNNVYLSILEIEDQQIAIKKFDEALLKRQQKSEEVAKLLASVDDYLLSELKIKLPIKQDNVVDNRIFKTSWQKVRGNRYDPKKYSQSTVNLYESINATSFKKTSLKSIITSTISGDWGLETSEPYQENLYKKCLVIRATEFDNKYNLKLENSRVKYRLLTKFKYQDLDIQENDLLVEKSGGSIDQPVGRIAIIDNEVLRHGTIAFSNFIHKFRVDALKADPQYIFCFLKTIHNIKLTDTMQSQTNGIRNLILNEYWKQTIPLPSLNQQKEIAKEITLRRNYAKKIEVEAEQDFRNSKHEIDQLILQ